MTVPTSVSNCVHPNKGILLHKPKLAEPPRIINWLIALLAIGAFWSESDFVTRLIPVIRFNIGLFELITIFLAVLSFLYFYKSFLTIKIDPLLVLVVFWFLASLVSLAQVSLDRFMWGALGVLILFLQLLFMLLLLNLLLQFPSILSSLFHWLVVAVLVMGVWVVLDQLQDVTNYNASGPFAGRSHMGIYMLGAFWLMLIVGFWPSTSSTLRWLATLATVLATYCVATSLRQSVYTSFVIGVIGLSASFFVLKGRERIKLSLFGLLPVLVGIVLLVSSAIQVDTGSVTQLTMFRREFLGLGDRLAMSVASEEEGKAFDQLQREGAVRAFWDHPFLGIGWNSFYRSEYSPTGHELHSSTLRFVAELGIVGVAIYICLLTLTIGRAGLLFLRMRNTPYQTPVFILFIAFGSLAVSHYYNRMFTDRPYWLLLVLLMYFDQTLGRPKKSITTIAQQAGSPHWLGLHKQLSD